METDTIHGEEPMSEQDTVSSKIMEKCVRCGTETKYEKSDNVQWRHGYIEGVGQLCFMCSQTRKMHKQGSYE